MHKINFFESGKGYPLVLIHGFCESNKIWTGLSQELSDEFRVICPDLPGFGKSPLPEKTFTLDQIGELLVHWLKDLGIKRCMVIGHSLGGYIALEMLRRFDGFVQSIVLFNSTAFGDPDDKKENRNKLIGFIREYGVEPFLKTFVPSLFYPPTATEYQHIIEQITRDGASISPEAVMYYAAAMRDRPDSTDLLIKYGERIFLIAGEFDQNVPLEKSKIIASHLPKNHAQIMPESAHMSVFEQSEQSCRAVRTFARQHSSHHDS